MDKRAVSVEKRRRYADWFWLKFGELKMCDCMRVRNNRSSTLDIKLRLEMGGNYHLPGTDLSRDGFFSLRNDGPISRNGSSTT